MADSIALGIPCEICGTDSWWDNRQNKKNPKAPDYKCKNRDCRDTSGYPMGRWEKNRAHWGKDAPKPQAPSAPTAPAGGRLTPDDTTPDEQGKRVFTYEALTYTYSVLLRKTVEAFEKAKVPLDPNAVQAAVATLLIQGEKAHIPLLHPRKVEPAQAPPKPKPVPPGLDADDWSNERPPIDSEDPWP